MTQDDPSFSPTPAVAPPPAGVPTLADLHDELAASTAESRRGQRRILDALKQFGTVLDALSATASDTHKAVRTAPTAPAPAASGDLPRDWALALVELTDRIDRVAASFDRPPDTTRPWWPRSRRAMDRWQSAWQTQAEAFSILRAHAVTLLKRAGLEAVDEAGGTFDPALMTAVESCENRDRPDHTVLAVILPGWIHPASGQVVRPAQVRVSRQPRS